MHQKTKSLHAPVLLGEVIKYLDPKPGDQYLDLTAGYGGHAAAVLALTRKSQAVLVDRDQKALEYLKTAFKHSSIRLIHSDFLTASKELFQSGNSFDLILADLGISSPHINNSERGFSLKQDGPLDMRMDQKQSLTADEIINTYSEADLANILNKYGEEPKAKSVAKQIIANRPIGSTLQLRNIIAKVASRQLGKIDPATRSFQAIRIAVNDELNQLQVTLPIWLELLKPGGRIVVISFHSLEDRLVKQAFADAGGNRYDATIKILTSTPVTASKDEIAFNPRARSAKLRAAVKIKTKPL